MSFDPVFPADKCRTGACLLYTSVLNITEDHLNRHHTMEEYIRVKELIVKNQKPEDVCVLNYEDPVLREFGKSIVPKQYIFPVNRRLNRAFSWMGTE